MKIRKAIIPAAGMGTRMLPATKSIPKEMLTIVDKPVIQYVVEEAVSSGITDILIIISEGKEAIIDHFNSDPDRITELRNRGKNEIADQLLAIDQLANIEFIYQRELSGLGDAINCGKDFIENEPFAVLLGDSIIESTTNESVLKQMVDIFDDRISSIVAVTAIDPKLVYKYGVLDGKKTNQENLFHVNTWIEKPPVESAPSNLVISGIYILTPEIFDCLDNTQRGHGNEIQLTDAMCLLLKQQPMLAFHFSGRRFDVGNKLDFITTNMHYGLKSNELSEQLKKWINENL